MSISFSNLPIQETMPIKKIFFKSIQLEVAPRPESLYTLWWCTVDVDFKNSKEMTDLR